MEVTSGTSISKQLMSSVLSKCGLYIRKMRGVPYSERVTNKEALERAGAKRNLMKDICERQARFFGHVIGKQGMEKLLTTGKFKDEKQR